MISSKFIYPVSQDKLCFGKYFEMMVCSLRIRDPDVDAVQTPKAKR